MGNVRVMERICIVVLSLLVLYMVRQAFGAINAHLRDAALQDAVRTGDTTRAEILLQQGANIETRSADPNWREDEFTPLALAVARGDIRMVKMLLAHGANPNALTLAQKNFPARDMILSIAAEKGSAEVVKLLLDAGGHVDARTGMAVTPLMLAARDNHADVVKLLIERGADVNARDERGFSPLSFATAKSRKNKGNIIRMLHRAGAKS